MDQTKIPLLDALLVLETKTEYERFLADILTRKELAVIAKRWRVLCLLHEGSLRQREICSRAGVSLGTVSRASQVLKHGTGAAQQIIQKLQKSTKEVSA